MKKFVMVRGYWLKFYCHMGVGVVCNKVGLYLATTAKRCAKKAEKCIDKIVDIAPELLEES